MGSVAHLKPAEAGSPARTLGQVLHAARPHRAWAPKPVSRDILEQLHALLSVGPSMIDASPTQVLFLTSSQAKDRLADHLVSASRDAALAAPACAIVGYDVDFAEQLVEFLPHAAGAPSCFDRPEVVRQTAIRNGTLQGAYLIVAARSLGLEAAAIPDFDAAGVSFEFFRAPRVRATFLCSLGYPADAKGASRRPRGEGRGPPSA
jgi:3-hydroxypropanoate dehydrogenase